VFFEASARCRRSQHRNHGCYAVGLHREVRLMPQLSPRLCARWRWMFAWACLISMAVFSQTDAASTPAPKTPSGATAQKKSEAYKPPPQGRWRETANMTTARSNHTATRLLSGQVLVVGGESSDMSTATAELFDPTANGGQGAWTDAGSLNQRRVRHTATLLANGTVLVIGGMMNSGGYTDIAFTSVEVFAPAANHGLGAWNMAAPLQVGRWGHTATLLPTGKVLVVGGYTTLTKEDPGHVVDAIELYDPAANAGQGASQIIGRLNPTHDPRNESDFPPELYFPTATLLPSGAVLLVGNTEHERVLSSCEHKARHLTIAADERTVQTDPASETLYLCFVTATRLSDGRVLVVPDSSPDSSSDSSLYTDIENKELDKWARLYYQPRLYDDTMRGDARRGAWTEMAVPRRIGRHHRATLLPNGTVLVTGGGNSRKADVYDPAAPRGKTPWAATAEMQSKREDHTATLLLNGTVLVVGGENRETGRLTSAEIYEPTPK